MKPPTKIKNPTVMQLATIAAGLSRKEEPGDWLVNYAMEIWQAAHAKLHSAPKADVVTTPPEIPMPKKFPLTKDGFLRLMLPGFNGRTGEYNAIFRQYLAHRIQHPTPPSQILDVARENYPDFDCLNPRVIPGQSEGMFPYSLHSASTISVTKVEDFVNKRFEQWAKEPIPDSASYFYHAKHFQNWYGHHAKAELKKNRSDAGKKGAEAKKAKKTVAAQKLDREL